MPGEGMGKLSLTVGQSASERNGSDFYISLRLKTLLQALPQPACMSLLQRTFPFGQMRNAFCRANLSALL